MNPLFNWIDQRTGAKKLVQAALFENVPGGARWRYVWGSTLVFCFTVQVITGIFLWLAYSPGSQTAWESVYYIQHEMAGGWFLRGIHHFTAQAMTVLLLLHLLQVVIDGAYKAPREVNYWTGVLLLVLVLALSLTGYLLPWDQKGFWATKVATNIAGITPVVGPAIQQLVVGGADYGHHTLTRFFALHAGIIPGAIIAFIGLHVYLFRKHGLTAKEPRRRPDEPFWPRQVMRDAVACLAVLAAVLFLVIRNHGAPLGAPADPSEPYAAARPEWYFLFLFQFLKYFPGGTEVWGAIAIPALLLLLVGALPVLGRWNFGHRFNLGFLGAMLAGVGLLTWLAAAEDGRKPEFQAAAKAADFEAERVLVLARAPAGIPVSGAVTLLRTDPLVRGPKLFAQHCASCHRFDGHDGLGGQPGDKQTASDLKGFASREWLAGLLDPAKVDTLHYFGGTAHKEGDMAKFVKKDVAAFSPSSREELRKALLALSAEAGLKSQQAVEQREIAIIEEGRRILGGDDLGCIECHTIRGDSHGGEAPDLTGYGSKEWLTEFVSNAGSERFYLERNDRMPAFGEGGRMTRDEISLVVDWLRGEWYAPADGGR
jgi:ubiquinol-cytochrome c reductase cytochrome b subunit